MGRGVELVEIDAIEPEPAQRCLAGGAKMVGAAWLDVGHVGVADRDQG